ncbi:uncharacterized protein LOC141664516 [Apium graveolens]|uniref:uncharacterized protein LOC141664512 n=1 Tax=Apium graveolens TaxID=4045 RepID=UPI003D7ADA32
MDPKSEKQLDYEGVVHYDELYDDLNIVEGIKFQLSEAQGPSSSGADNEVIDEDDMCDELYGDLNINVGFLQLHLSKSPGPSANGAVNTSIGIYPSNTLCKVADEYVPSLDPDTSIPQMSPNVSNDNLNVNHHFISNDNPVRPTGDNGETILLVGELHWWTTDTEIESVSSKYGTLEEIKFFDEKANGKSRGYCQVEFYDSIVAALCKEGMNGYIFNGRACTLEFASSDALWKMVVSYIKRNSKSNLNLNMSQRRGL